MSGPHPMHAPCGWFAAKTQGAVGNEGYCVEYASVGEIADAVVDLIVKEAGK